MATALVSLPFIFHFTLTTATTTASGNLVINLIHYESSTLSPYNSKDAIKNLYSHKIIKQASSNEYISNLVPSPRKVVFLMNFSIGEPPIPQLAVMDTGSSLTWVMCHPCTSCSQQSVPIFDPSKSSTYASLTCSECNQCDVMNSECPYSVEYVGSGSSEGVYAREQLTLETLDESIVRVPSLIFGCGRKFSISSNGYPYQGINGVFGLGSGRFSLLPSFGKKFSYCIGNLRNANYKFNKLVLGDKANMQGDSTTLNVINGLYYVNLEAISIGGKKIDIDSTVFERSATDNNSGVIIDSGADHTWLTKYGFEVLSFEVENLLEGVLAQDKHNTYTLCYNGVVSRDLSGFPVVTFHFAEGAVLDLDAASMFIQTSENVFCMAVLPGNYFGDDYESFSSIGMLAQQNYNVGYDLNGMRVYFQRIDCELLDG
ncbi:aspartic proteinase CDR1 [Cajanus cajan]|uniref:Aspartic proteinase nepenthesin-1 n=1 Tax=Cajanus cajan TaxID=3821 RepID=A0A151S9G8_CAJCA|nr:aspartic proteinase CDR1 [Cajanus cajan]KYP51442.1 Aspartic proteinase nepenthesin-1 [Cajanus cajan]